jgi:hypothetical protein
MSTSAELANYLNRRIPEEWRTGYTWLFGPSGRPSVEQLAQQFSSDAEFTALQVGKFLATPNGQLISCAVAFLIPPLSREDAELVEAALMMAATARTKEQRQAALFAAVVGIALFAGAILSSQSSNRT